MIDELNGLAGAYALDALLDDERDTFEFHLKSCTDCAEEVLSLQNAAAELSHLEATTPPPELRTALLAEISRVRPLAPHAGNVVPLHRAKRAAWGTQLLAAACALVAILAGSWGWQQHQQAHRAASTASALPADSRVVSGSVGQAGTATVVYSKSTGSFVMNLEGAATLTADKTYQAWLIDRTGRATSVGTFLPGADGSVSMHARGDLADADRLGVTVEPAGGSNIPTGRPVTVTL